MYKDLKMSPHLIHEFTVQENTYLIIQRKTRRELHVTVRAARGEPSKADSTISLFKKASYICLCNKEIVEIEEIVEISNSIRLRMLDQRLYLRV